MSYYGEKVDNATSKVLELAKEQDLTINEVENMASSLANICKQCRQAITEDIGTQKLYASMS